MGMRKYQRGLERELTVADVGDPELLATGETRMEARHRLMAQVPPITWTMVREKAQALFEREPRATRNFQLTLGRVLEAWGPEKYPWPQAPAPSESDSHLLERARVM